MTARHAPSRTDPQRAQIAAALRAILRRRMARAAGRRSLANPFRRLAAAVAHAPRMCKLARPDQPGQRPLTFDMPFGPFSLPALGLGLAGGGGGGPGWRAMVTQGFPPAQETTTW
ncbi:hypothetical protein [Paracoccus jiaweipingae]|uniref:hypothetical protein n=1 Tax=unclassified Paracoccus (in: a-proteobacteria) TaxID=2688777 RepID=UPI0037AC8F0C